MKKNVHLLTEEVQALAQRSVLCWLATVDAEGKPNVSPKEIWAIADAQHVVVADIASPVSVRNIVQHPQVCLSFVDVFVQKGFKIVGVAQVIEQGSADFKTWAAPLLKMVEERFVIKNVLLIRVEKVVSIVAPSYRFYPEETTEMAQVKSAMQAYGMTAIRRS